MNGSPIQDWAMRTVMLVQAWQWNGMAVVLYLAGLQNVPEDLKHAAMVDGARRWQVFRDITFPMLAPAFTVVTVLSFILIFRAFDLIYVLSGPLGRAGRATLVIGVLIYGDAFGTSGFSSQPRMSYAIAEGVTLFIFLAGVAACSSGCSAGVRRRSTSDAWRCHYPRSSTLQAPARAARTLRRIGGAVVWHGVMIVACAFVSIPIVMVVLGSFKTVNEFFASPYGLPGVVRAAQLQKGVCRGESAGGAAQQHRLDRARVSPSAPRWPAWRRMVWRASRSRDGWPRGCSSSAAWWCRCN